MEWMTVWTTICKPRRALMLRRLLRALRTLRIGRTLEMLRNVKPAVQVQTNHEESAHILTSKA